MTKTLIEQYEKGYSTSALQHKYSLSYEQGCELADEFRKLHEDREILARYVTRRHPEMDGWIKLHFVRRERN